MQKLDAACYVPLAASPPPPPPPCNLGCRQVILHEQNERTKNNRCKILMAPVAAGSNPESLKSWICWEAGDSQQASASNCRRRMDGEAITCRALPDTCKAVHAGLLWLVKKQIKAALYFYPTLVPSSPGLAMHKTPREFQPGLQPLHTGCRALSTRGVFSLLPACKLATPW